MRQPYEVIGFTVSKSLTDLRCHKEQRQQRLQTILNLARNNHFWANVRGPPKNAIDNWIITQLKPRFPQKSRKCNSAHNAACGLEIDLHPLLIRIPGSARAIQINALKWDHLISLHRHSQRKIKFPSVSCSWCSTHSVHILSTGRH